MNTHPNPSVILALIEKSGGAIDPTVLMDTLTIRYSKADVIEATQCAIERGDITLDNDGMVVRGRP